MAHGVAKRLREARRVRADLPLGDRSDIVEEKELDVDQGALIVEVGEGQAEAVSDMLRGSPQYSGVETHRDLSGRKRFLTAVRSRYVAGESHHSTNSEAAD